ncbi:prokineticin-2 [Pelobates fuscus]|uniref:prokineticin-2 n=1 Tax=Pelobates fuscus TaxID=191477 RepID=UPI002FE4DF90
MRKYFALLLGATLLLSMGEPAVVTGVCDKDEQCRNRTCCAVSLWIRSIRVCTPLGSEDDECHPLSHRVPFLGKRLHHTCPCLPGLICTRLGENRYKCLKDERLLFLQNAMQQI